MEGKYYFLIIILKLLNHTIFQFLIFLFKFSYFLVTKEDIVDQATGNLLWMIYDIIYFRKQTAPSEERLVIE